MRSPVRRLRRYRAAAARRRIPTADTRDRRTPNVAINSSHVAIGATSGIDGAPALLRRGFRDALPALGLVIAGAFADDAIRSQRHDRAAPSSIAFSTIRSIFDPFGIALRDREPHGRFARAAIERRIEHHRRRRCRSRRSMRKKRCRRNRRSARDRRFPAQHGRDLARIIGDERDALAERCTPSTKKRSRSDAIAIRL